MDEYTLPHRLAGERERLALMSALLDPLERSHIARLGVSLGWRCLELGSGNGSIAQALAERVGPTGHVVASDIDLAYIVDLQAPCLEVRRINILQDGTEESSYDFCRRARPASPSHACPQGLGAHGLCSEARWGTSFYRTGYAALHCHRAGFDVHVLAKMAEVVG